jgi:hypothetical protein
MSRAESNRARRTPSAASTVTPSARSALGRESDEEFDRWASRNARRLDIATSGSRPRQGTAQLPHHSATAKRAGPTRTTGGPRKTPPTAAVPEKRRRAPTVAATLSRPRGKLARGAALATLILGTIAGVAIATNGGGHPTAWPRPQASRQTYASEAPLLLLPEKPQHRAYPNTMTRPARADAGHIRARGPSRLPRRPAANTSVSNTTAVATSSQLPPSTASSGSSAVPVEQTPVQQTPVQQTSDEQTPNSQTSAQQTPSQQTSVDHQSPSQPAGPTSLGGQVGNNCAPKCS